ncbi:protein-S-isoprenylcysteine O-methyltransferase [Petromyzon marinus]|uniref:Protein-S-isoprenylcysteine O-methyltransferase n=1 Tax=Petromyzon marinus TaxID=7757 RepID=A0AAJ7TUB4_PETMA|nr:protein-S-isoprenylcysteine O-methyltransferase [Petromyzon marinus]
MARRAPLPAPGREGLASAKCFALGLCVVALPLAFEAAWSGVGGRVASVVYLALVNAGLLVAYRGRHDLYQVAVRACFLGFAFGCGLILSLSNTSWKHFGWYVCSLSFFHYSEYLVTALINPRSLNLDSFLLNHSLEYKLAAVASWVEFTLEMLLFPGLKDVRWLSVAGLAMVVGGEALRKAAMLTAGSNFSHIVQSERSESHQLVTRGVYAFSRHPSYVGWFYWSIGTQIVLCNPLCVVGYTVASWRFFRERIEDEELTLLNFFGEQYMDYKTNVPTRLPFIDGFRVEL